VTVADDSTTTLHAQATDALGNVSPCGDAVAYVEDSTGPAIALEAPAPGDARPVLRGVAGTAPRDGDEVTMAISTSAGTPVATLTTTRAADGSFSVRPASALLPFGYVARATQSDSVGNTGRAEVSFDVPLVEPPPPPPPPPPPASKLTFSLARAKLDRGKVRLKLKCTGAATCRGTIVLQAAKGSAKGKRVSYTVAGGTTKDVLLTLPKTTAKELTKQRKAKVRVVSTPAGGRPATKAITIRR
jgi:hypothetical protein